MLGMTDWNEFMTPFESANHHKVVPVAISLGPSSIFWSSWDDSSCEIISDPAWGENTCKQNMHIIFPSTHSPLQFGESMPLAHVTLADTVSVA